MVRTRLAALIHDRQEEILAIWLNRVQGAEQSHYRERPADRVASWLAEGVNAIQQSLELALTAPLEAHAALVGATRQRLGFEIDEVVDALLQLKEVGLSGNWTLVPDSNFYVNKTEADPDAGTGKAVYDRPSGDNGARTATRNTTVEHVLYETDGDLFYASFLIEPARAGGDMTFELELIRLDGGGSVDFSFGISNGTYIVGNGGISGLVSGGTVTADEQLVVVRIENGDTSSGGLDDNEVVTLWVDPADESSLPVIDGVSAELLNCGGGRIVTVSIRGDQMDGQPAFFDDLNVGLSFADVMPATLSLVFADGFESGTTDLWSSVTP